MKGVEYIRHSTDLQENSRQNQHNIISEYAEKKGIKVINTYEDLGISGGSMLKRPGLMQLLLDAEKKPFDCVLFYKFDRAFRNLEEQIYVFKKLKALGIKYIGVTDPEGEGASGELILNILGAVNQFERELTGERIYDNNRQRAMAGYWTGSSNDPIGYVYDKVKKSLNIDEKEAEIVREIFNLYLQYESANKVAALLRDKGYTTKKGNVWTVDRVLDVLRNEVYIGKLRWGHRVKVQGKNWHKRTKDYEVFDGNHQPIVSEEIFKKAKSLRELNSVTQRKPSSGYFLSGLAKCSLCGGRITGHKNKYGNFYRCEDKYFKGNSCPGWQVYEKYIEGPIFSAIIHNIKNSGLAEQYKSNDITFKKVNPEKKIKQIDEKLKRIKLAYENGIDTLEEYVARKKELTEEKKKLGDAPAEEPNNELLESLLSFENLWPRLTALEKNQYIKQICQKILISREEITIIFEDADLKGWQKSISAKPLSR